MSAFWIAFSGHIGLTSSPHTWIQLSYGTAPFRLRVLTCITFPI